MYTKNQIIEEIRRIATNIGKKSLTRKDFDKHSKISASSVKYHFGTWNDAIKEAGLIPVDTIEIICQKTLVENDVLLLDLIRLYNEYGKEPTGSLINAKGKYSEYPYRENVGEILEKHF